MTMTGDLPHEPEPVPPRHNSKPNPDEPFRFVCPDCERQVYRDSGTKTYRCDGCKSYWSKDNLKDKKRKRRQEHE